MIFYKYAVVSKRFHSGGTANLGAKMKNDVSRWENKKQPIFARG